jgi:hypothetical protein
MGRNGVVKRKAQFSAGLAGGARHRPAHGPHGVMIKTLGLNRHRCRRVTRTPTPGQHRFNVEEEFYRKALRPLKPPGSALA